MHYVNPTTAEHYLPQEAQVIDYRQEAPSIFSLRLRFTDPTYHQNFQFQPGQFNMVYLYGVGEVAISIASDPDERDYFEHTIRPIGQVTQGLAALKPGNTVGLRGPYGNGWPLEQAQQQDIVIVTGGLGCAPAVCMIDYIMKRREQFGHVYILQGIKHSDDLIFKKHYQRWKEIPETTVFIAADTSGPQWPFYTGHVTDFLRKLPLKPDRTIAMMCGPEAMMKVSTQALNTQGLHDKHIFLNMERNMHCALAHCGHCQLGGHFVCKDGPIFSYDKIKSFIDHPGF